MKKINSSLIYKKKLKILENTKKIVRKSGWSQEIYKKIIDNKTSLSDLVYYFPNGYKDLLNFSLSEINKSFENKVKKININNLPLNKKIKKMLLIRIEIINEDIIFFKKTFNHLLLPQNSKIMKKNLYNSVDTMWYLAGDNSTDFSYYTKRIILTLIYANALFVLYNKDINEVELNIDKNLKRISKIPKIKDRFSFIKDNLPIFLKGIIN